MRIQLHQNQKDALLYSVSAIATRALGFILLPVYARVLSPSEFGLVSVALVISGLLQMIVLPGIEGLYLRYGFQGYTHQKSNSNLIGTILRCHLFLAFAVIPLLGILVLSISKHISSEVPGTFIALAIATLSIESLQAPLVARFKASRTIKELALFELAQLILTAVAILTCLFVFRLGPISLLLGEMICALLLLPINLTEILKYLRASPFIKDSFKTIAKSFLAIGPESFFYWALTAADRYGINLTHGAEQTGIYVAGYQFGSLVVSLSSIGARHWKVLLFQTYVEKQYPRKSLKNLYRETFSLFFILASFLAVMAKPLALTVLGRRFAASQTIIPIVMAIVCLRIPMAFFSMYCWAKQFRRIVVVVNAIAFVIFLASLVLLVPKYGSKGAAWSGFFACLPFTLAFYFLNVEEFLFDRKYLKPGLILAILAFFGVLLFPSTWLALGSGVVLLVVLVFQLRRYFSALASLN